MDAGPFVTELLNRSGLRKSELSARSGISRALIDDYLKARKQPTLRQLNRLAEAAGTTIELKIHQKPKPLPQAFIEVLEFGELFDAPSSREPLPDLSKVWREAA